MIDIQANIKDVYKSMHLTLSKNPKTVKKMTRAVATSGKAEAKKTVYSSVSKGTGDLKRKYVSNVYRGQTNAYIVVRSAYASTLEYGAVFKPKEKEFMTFQINGSWVKLRQYEVKPQLGFHETLDRYYSSSAPLKIMEKKLMEELNKIW